MDGALYHVCARPNRNEMILDGGTMKEIFLGVVKRAREKYDFRMEFFFVIGNRFHFLIRPGEGSSLPDIMRWIMGVSAMAYNRRKGASGRVWECRYRASVMLPPGEIPQASSREPDAVSARRSQAAAVTVPGARRAVDTAVARPVRIAGRGS